ncbi:S-adenosyl-L-methionine-dependent methyltransferase [Tilletiaria anomala UBC 951]|uniref:S-adenosyl-L-methionine-dependent methyltransferase n=1 Tax=Tilletiaria anomala (strain ATCC 24038 / CBS 436.72 / UBC 951) TaxID=1037660 RepID=A0A066WPL0_TILAU|nr:S-adenosyl-L-methionine-dependent methyltransferase [Tilletiaria anomala UBC 951]KDN52560.1 S-adenosyl-L-methionine-dependent methyltransferase [Tilletiaria anomala UBC 951]
MTGFEPLVKPNDGKRRASRSLSPAGAVEEASHAAHPCAPRGAYAEASTSKQQLHTQQPDKKKRKMEAQALKRLRKDAAEKIAKFGEDPIFYEAQDLLGESTVQAILEAGKEFERKFERGEELVVDVKALGAGGHGLAVAPTNDWIISVPKALPGERVRVTIQSNDRLFSKARVVHFDSKSSELRTAEPFCRYFDQCGGCQYQNMAYPVQLELKQRVVQNAFKHYSGLDPSVLPAIGPTMPSPKQRAYRTKLTPHFNLPPEARQYRRTLGFRRGNRKRDESLDEGGPLPVKPSVEVAIGFDGQDGKVMDIEECPIGTETINKALPEHRQRIKDTIFDFPNGATLLLRDSLSSFDSPESPCVAITDHKATVKEMVENIKFESPAGAFFQNNRSILPDLLGYVRDEIIASRAHDATDANGAVKHYLVDAYCGSGLFSLCLAHLFDQVAGVELSSESIKCAQTNAELNGIKNAKFLAGNAENIFGTIDYEPQQTTVIIDPPRRGCDDAFIEQLVKLAPRNVVYVSCNVHTQARDVGSILTKDPAYNVLSIRGADLFPQTNHVEGICVLRRD